MMFDIISPLYVYRLARCREYDRTRQATMTPEQRETVLQQRRDRRAMMREEQTDRQTVQPHSRPQSKPQSRNVSTLKIDDPNVIQRIQHFHRTLSDLHNVFCDVCKERFPTINSNELGICHRCHADSLLPKLFSHEHNMDPDSVPIELCVSCIFVIIS